FVEYSYAAVGKSILVEPDQRRKLTSQPGHGGIKVNEVNPLHTFMPEDFAHRQAIAAAQNQYTARRRGGAPAHCGMYQRFVIAVFIFGGELDMSVNEQP